MARRRPTLNTPFASWRDIDLRQPLTDHPLNQGRVGWWLVLPPWRGSNTFRDLLGKSHGALTNGPTWTGPQGRPGSWGALQFDGVDDHIDCGTDPALNVTEAVTLYAEFYAITGTGSGTWQQIAGKGSVFSANSSYLMVYNGTSLRFYIDRAGSSLTSVSLASFGKDKWVQAAGTYDRQNLRLYADNLQASAAETLAIASEPVIPFVLGRGSTLVSGDIFGGLIKEVSLFRRALSADEFAELKRQSLRGYPDLLRRRKRTTYFVTAAGGGGDTYTRSLADDLGIQDVVARIAAGQRSLTDSLAGQDAVSRQIDAQRSLAENLAVQDAVARQTVALRQVADLLGISDITVLTMVAAGAHAIAVVDSLGLLDEIARQVAANRQAIDILAVQDVYSRTVTSLRLLTDTLVAADAVSRQTDALRQLVDTLGLADVFTHTVIVGAVLSIAVSDLVGVADAFSRQASATRQLADNLGIDEDFSRISQVLRAFTDTLGLGDIFRLPGGGGFAGGGKKVAQVLAIQEYQRQLLQQEQRRLRRALDRVLLAARLQRQQQDLELVRLHQLAAQATAVVLLAEL